MTKSRLGALFFLLFSILYFYKSYDIHLLPGSHFDVMNARTFPFYLGVLGVALSILMLILSFVKPDPEDRLDWEKLKGYDFKKGLYLVAAMIFYGLTIRTLGFIISTILFLSIGFLILGERSVKVILLTSVGVSVVFWFLLTKILGVYIEQGVIFDYILGAQS